MATQFISDGRCSEKNGNTKVGLVADATAKPTCITRLAPMRVERESSDTADLSNVPCKGAANTPCDFLAFCGVSLAVVWLD